MRADKQRALLDGALKVFARDGYTRASIQTLAAESQVSTRTIYNQYGNKEELFRAVILDSATREAERQIAVATQYLGDVSDIRQTLIDFGMEWSTARVVSADHFRMMRQIDAEREHIDPAVVAVWREAGPDRSRHAVGALLLDLDRRGLLTIDDGELAAVHLIQLTAGAVGILARDDVPETRTNEEVMAAGVDVFLTHYGRRQPEK